MTSTPRTIATILGTALLLTPASAALGQSATVDLGNQKQYVRGFGGMVHIPWAGDLTAAERTLAFGNGSGQLGLTVLRIAVPDGNTSTSSYVATAKAVIAAGGLVYASPWNSGGDMSSSEFASYADHLESFVTYMKSQGAELYAISVQNEPDYGDWRHWSATAVHDFIVNYGAKISTKLMTAESFQYRKTMYDQLLNDDKALANWDILGAHTYGTQVRDYAYPLFDQKGVPAGKERWMTEHYTDSNTDANQWPNALNVASDVHTSMVEGDFNVYTWWYIKRSYGPINNGAITKRGWCMAHWSKFVRPGYYRVDATKSPASNVSLSAFKGTDDVVLVAVNKGSGNASLSVAIKGATVASCDKYTTSSSKSLASEGKVSLSGGSLTASLDGSSVTTFRCTSDDIPVGGSGGASGAAGATGAGGSTRSGPDGGRGTGGVVGGGGNGGSGAGGRTGRGSGGGPGTGGAVASGGTLGSGGVGNGSGGQVGSGGVEAVGGSQDEAGGALGAGGASQAGSSDVTVAAGEGCACRAGRPGGREGALAGLLALPLLAWYLRRRRRT
jgi:glucuronoarabinoxylan endo-1,4-beta-xylanase